MDDNIIKIYETDVYPYKLFGIFINKNSISGEIDIRIDAIVV